VEILFSRKFQKGYRSFPDDIQNIIDSKLKIFAENPFHPSLRVKKIKAKEDIFECSINRNIRMTWCYHEKKVLLRAIGEHDKNLKNP